MCNECKETKNKIKNAKSYFLLLTIKQLVYTVRSAENISI